jgi:LysM repeat protein
MYHLNKRPIVHGLILCAAFSLLFGCAAPKEPYSVVEDESREPEQITVQANITPPPPRETIVYAPEHPQTYIVQKGDTLWDISSEFLRDPWYWPEIWYKNPQVENPHLIYPGDELAIIYVGGQKRVQLVRRGDTGKALASGGLTVVKLSPRIRAQSIDASIPSIPIESIRQLLERPIIIPEQDLADSAYILDSRDNHLANAINDTLYVRNLDTSGVGRYQIFRPHKPLIDIVTGEALGYEALYVGEAKLERKGDPASVRITESAMEALRDDRLLPISNSTIERDFFPRAPKTDVEGRIISLLDGISQVGQFQTVVVNLGLRDDVGVGNILEVLREGKVVIDRNEEEEDFPVKLPDERSGLIMIIRAYEKMSFALVMIADAPIKLGDPVLTP